MKYQVGIIGAGFAGLVAALQLKKSGRSSFVIFERAAEPGGTWRDNVYPGCACDVASPLYSFAGEPNPHWNRLYADQRDILQYIKDVVQKHNLHEHIRYNTEVAGARFQKRAGGWEITDAGGHTTFVNVLIAGTGPLNRPCIPGFPGLALFRGKIFHSSAWDHDCDLAGKKVAVIGTGASAIQIIPAIAPKVSRLFVFQRTPPWVSERADRFITPSQQSRWKRFPFLLRLQREKIYWLNELLGLGFIGQELVNRLMRIVVSRRLTKQVKD
ncbi:MAG: NAD(P)/FAD-dependent oxidoreductase, partial [Williamsia sp.]|nr:NAD(P)/FAD-dependent oxidoreductase [Williamsia sp.]